MKRTQRSSSPVFDGVVSMSDAQSGVAHGAYKCRCSLGSDSMKSVYALSKWWYHPYIVYILIYIDEKNLIVEIRWKFTHRAAQPQRYECLEVVDSAQHHPIQ